MKTSGKNKKLSDGPPAQGPQGVSGVNLYFLLLLHSRPFMEIFHMFSQAAGNFEGQTGLRPQIGTEPVFALATPGCLGSQPGLAALKPGQFLAPQCWRLQQLSPSSTKARPRHTFSSFERPGVFLNGLKCQPAPIPHQLAQDIS